MEGSAAYCAQCGASVVGARFCTQCGTPVGRVGAAPPLEPAYAAPPPVSAPAPAPVVVPAPAPTPVLLTPTPSHASTDGHGGPGPGLWLGAAAVLLVIVLLGTWLLVRGGSGSPSAGPTPPIVPPASHTTHAASSPTTTPTSSAPTSPSATPGQVGKAADVAGLARAVAPAHAPAAVDFGGNRVTYDASNLVDGAPDTCWRVAGDATGTVLTFRLDQPTRLTKVGLVNGYAKTAFSRGHRFDWYAGNRRILSVDWSFDDGSAVSQSFSTSRGMQTETIDPVTTSVVRLRITSVSAPGHGRSARNDTAISEVTLVGRPG